MCNSNERYPTVEESQIKVGYKIFITRDYHGNKGLFSVFSNNRNNDMNVMYEYRDSEKDAEGYYVTEVSPINKLSDEQKGFHAFVSFDDAEKMFLHQNKEWNSENSCYILAEVAVDDIGAMGEYLVNNESLKVFRCGKVKILRVLESTDYLTTYNSPQ